MADRVKRLERKLEGLHDELDDERDAEERRFIRRQITKTENALDDAREAAEAEAKPETEGTEVDEETWNAFQAWKAEQGEGGTKGDDDGGKGEGDEEPAGGPRYFGRQRKGA